MKGWNKEGIPTLASLYDLGLDYVAEEFLERGILNEGDEEAPAEEVSAEK
jgi:benzoyl-CoA reductase subunit BamB